MYYYVYRLDHIITGEFYFGSRESEVHPTLDNYLGSMVVWKPDKSKLKKTIIKDDFKCREDAIEFESNLIKENINNLLNKNYSVPNKHFFIDHNLFNYTDHQKGSKNSQFDTCWITNGIEIKKVKKDNLILKDGWILGRKLKPKYKNNIVPRDENGNYDKSNHIGSKNSQFNTHWITNGIENRKINDDENIPEGWKFGCVNFKSRNVHWITNGIENKRLKHGNKIPDGWKIGKIQKKN